MKIIDLSTPIENDASEPFPPQIIYKDHANGAERLGKLAGVDPDAFPDRMALATEQITLTTHTGTHIDSPYHYGPTVGGKRARTVDEVPLDWCYGPGVRLDFTRYPEGSFLTDRDVMRALADIDHEIRPGEIVLIQTGTDKYWKTDRYMTAQSGLTRSGTQWLVERGVRCIGIDAWGLDPPVGKMAEAYRAGDTESLWGSHMYGREREYLQIEKLANLDKLPATGFTVAAFPVKIAGASAGWCRAVAMVG
ncbi:MAG: cyclase family protein [Spirochaetaceae bacterium]|nr:MAG: cyclase family protein [Spirochaetaceae bacterium]